MFKGLRTGLQSARSKVNKARSTRSNAFVADLDEDLKPGSGLNLQKVNDENEKENMNSDRLMGQAHRDIVTGVVKIISNRDPVPDFWCADLQTRDSITGTFDELASDIFLFKVVPLHYRTWIYHSSHRKGILRHDQDKESGAINAVIQESCIDSDIIAGRNSSIPAAAVIVLFSILAGDILYSVLMIIFLLAILFLAIYMDDPGRYRYSRIASLPLRVLVLVVMIALAQGWPWPLQGAVGVRFLAKVAGALVLVLDFICGDLNGLYCHSKTCSYKILRTLPNRVFVCERTGGGADEPPDYPKIHQKVSGFAQWFHSNTLLADIMGVIVELVPATAKEWKGLAETMRSSDAIFYFGIGSFNEDCPSCIALIQMQEEAELARKAAESLGMVLSRASLMPKPPDSAPPSLPPIPGVPVS